MSDVPQQILEQLKKNEAYLAQIAQTQTEALKISQKTLINERYRVVIMGLKLVFIVLLTWISLVFAKNLTQDLTRMVGGGSGLELGGASDLANELRGSQDLIREIMGE